MLSDWILEDNNQLQQELINSCNEVANAYYEEEEYLLNHDTNWSDIDEIDTDFDTEDWRDLIFLYEDTCRAVENAKNQRQWKIWINWNLK